MIYLITILLIIACVGLSFFVLIQNPKGGGLTGSFGSMSTQMMGVKETDKVMERGTWIFMSVIAVLCMASVLFIQTPGPSKKAPASELATTFKLAF